MTISNLKRKPLTSIRKKETPLIRCTTKAKSEQAVQASLYTMQRFCRLTPRCLQLVGHAPIRISVSIPPSSLHFKLPFLLDPSYTLLHSWHALSILTLWCQLLDFCQLQVYKLSLKYSEKTVMSLAFTFPSLPHFWFPIKHQCSPPFCPIVSNRLLISHLISSAVLLLHFYY